MADDTFSSNNDIRPFAPQGTLDVDLVALGTYENQEARVKGFQPDEKADQKILNRALRQALHVCVALSEFVSRYSTGGIKDDGDWAAASSTLEAALKKLVSSIPTLATVETAGVLRIATMAEVVLGTIENAAVNPLNLKLRMQVFTQDLQTYLITWVQNVLTDYATHADLAALNTEIESLVGQVNLNLQTQVDSQERLLEEILGVSSIESNSANLGPSTVADWQTILTNWITQLHPTWPSVPLNTKVFNQYDGHIWSWNGTLWVDMGFSGGGLSPKFKVNRTHSWTETVAHVSGTAIDIGLNYSVNRNMVFVSVNGDVIFPYNPALPTTQKQFREMKPSGGGFADLTPSDVDTISTQVVFNFDTVIGDKILVWTITSNVALTESMLQNYLNSTEIYRDAAEVDAAAAHASELAAATSLTACQALQNLIAQKLTNLSLPLVYSISQGQTISTIKLVVSNINPNDGSKTDTDIILPVASASAHGVMSIAEFNQLQANTQDIAGLKGQSRLFVVHMGATQVTDQATIQAAFAAALQGSAVGTNPTDGTTLVNLDEGNGHGAEYTWFSSDSTWHYRGTTTVSIATTSSIGVVLGSTDVGKIAVGSDGSMSVNGWAALQTQVSGKQADLGATSLSNSLPSPANSSTGGTSGTSTQVSRADHQHPWPGTGAPAGLTFGGSTVDGTANTLSRSDHQHALPALPTAAAATASADGATAGIVILAADSDKTSRSKSATPAGVAAQISTLQALMIPLAGSSAITGSLVPSTTNTVNLGSATNKFANVYATALSGVATSAYLADLGEWYTSKHPDAPVGTLMSVNPFGGAHAKIWEPGETILGVVSEKPGFILAGELAGKKGVSLIGLVGKVPIRISGPVLKGQRVKPASSGVAQAATQWSDDCFAIALESSKVEGEKLVLCVIK